MSIQQMRAAIYDVYPGRKWKIKVQNMPDDQVIAVYYSFLAKGKFKDGSVGSAVSRGDITDDHPKVREANFKPYVGEQLKIDI